MDPPKVRRRDFVAGGVALAGGAALVSCLPDVEGKWLPDGGLSCSWTEPSVTMGYPAQAGRVVEVHDTNLTQGSTLNAAVVAEDLKKVLLALTGAVDLKAAWAVVLKDLKPGQVVGIKVNTLNAKVPTHVELVQALVQSLKVDAGVGTQQLLVWDRRLDELTKAGITAVAVGCAVEGTVDSTSARGNGRGYEESATCLGSDSAKLTTIQTRAVDHLINLSVMKNHKASGFTGCLKNHYGTIDNPGNFHNRMSGETVVEDRFEKAIPTINALPEVAGKTRLWLMDAMVGVCKGDTDAYADCIPNRLLAGLDPVALDIRGREIRNTEAGGATVETTSDSWLAAAERVGLGKSKLVLESVT